VSFILSGFTSGETSYGSLVAGYSTLTFAILMIIIIVMMGALKLVEGKGMLETIMTILSSSGQFLLLLSVIGFVLYLIIYYKELIKSGNAASSYYNFTTLTTILILLQSYLIYTNLDTEKFVSTNKLPKVTSYMLYLLGVITWMSALIIYITLKYFNTDGFTLYRKP
jgi:hypothetical protein